MSTTRASAFLCWLGAAFGLALRWDALSNAPGGTFSNSPKDAAVGLVLFSAFSIAAVALHVYEFFGRKSCDKLDP